MVKRANAVEDGRYEPPVLNSTRINPSVDIDLLFAPKRKHVSGETGDIFKKLDYAAIKQSVKNIVMTNFGEKPFNTEFGGNIRGLLFENADPDYLEDLEALIASNIELSEPRARNVIVEIDQTYVDRNYLAVRVNFAVVHTLENISLETTIARIR